MCSGNIALELLWISNIIQGSKSTETGFHVRHCSTQSEADLFRTERNVEGAVRPQAHLGDPRSYHPPRFESKGRGQTSSKLVLADPLRPDDMVRPGQITVQHRQQDFRQVVDQHGRKIDISKSGHLLSFGK